MSSFSLMIARSSRVLLAAALATCVVASERPAGAEEPEPLACPGGSELKGRRPPDGRKEWCALPDGSQHGPSASYYESGELMARASFEKGELDGMYQAWHPNGVLAESGSYVRDQRQGPWRTWDASGNQLNEEEYVDGRVHGKYKLWLPNGQLIVAVDYVNGERHGPAVTFYENGQRRTEGVFRNGEYHGIWRGWYADGSVEKVAEFDEGQPLSRQEYSPGEHTGE